MDTLLTIDIDFWMNTRFNRETSIFIRNLSKLNVSIDSVIYHHELLLKLQNRTFDKLINMDYHSDLAGFDIATDKKVQESFNEGTWVNYVNFRQNSEYLWLHNHTDSSIANGICDTESDAFDGSITGWKKVSHESRFPSWDELKNVSYVVICVSPNWIHNNKYCKQIFNEFARYGWLSTQCFASFGINDAKYLTESENKTYKLLYK